MNHVKGLSKFFWGLILVLGLLGLSSQVGAENGESWLVRSEYQSPMPGRSNSTIWWRFARQKSAGGEVKVIISDLNNRVKLWAELFFNQSNLLSQADCYRYRRGEVVCDARVYDVSAPAIINQSLIPGDWLNRDQPFAEHEEVREFVVVEKIGITDFSSHLIVTEKKISLAEACAAGMIDGDCESIGEGAKLYLVTVTKVSQPSAEEEIVLRQLWAAGDDFWLYEEKIGRRSWCQDIF